MIAAWSVSSFFDIVCLTLYNKKEQFKYTEGSSRFRSIMKKNVSKKQLFPQEQKNSFDFIIFQNWMLLNEWGMAPLALERRESQN